MEIAASGTGRRLLGEDFSTGELGNQPALTAWDCRPCGLFGQVSAIGNALCRARYSSATLV